MVSDGPPQELARVEAVAAANPERSLEHTAEQQTSSWKRDGSPVSSAPQKSPPASAVAWIGRRLLLVAAPLCLFAPVQLGLAGLGEALASSSKPEGQAGKDMPGGPVPGKETGADIPRGPLPGNEPKKTKAARRLRLNKGPASKTAPCAANKVPRQPPTSPEEAKAFSEYVRQVREDAGALAAGRDRHQLGASLLAQTKAEVSASPEGGSLRSAP